MFRNLPLLSQVKEESEDDEVTIIEKSKVQDAAEENLESQYLLPTGKNNNQNQATPEARYSFTNLKTVFQDGAVAYKKLTSPCQTQQDNDNTLGTSRSLSIKGLYQNDGLGFWSTDQSRNGDSFLTKLDDNGQDSDRASSFKSLLSPRLLDSDREVKDWLKMRDLQKRQSKIDLVVRMKKILEIKIDFSPIPFLYYFNEIRTYDFDLA